MKVNANTEIYDKSLDRAAMIRLYEKRMHGKVSVVIDGHSLRIYGIVENSKKIAADLKAEIRKTFQEINRITSGALINFSKDQLSFTFQNIDNTVGKIWRTQRPTRMVAEDIVLKRPLYAEKTLEQGWSSIGVGERKRIEALIRRGIANGDTQSEIALAVRKSNVMKITRAQSEALVTTATTSVHAQSDHAVFMTNEKAIAGWQYVAILDNRTTEICIHRDGKVYPVSDSEHLPPAHYRCRSKPIPVFKSWEDMSKLEGVAHVRRRNLASLTPDQVAFYDGVGPLKESYNGWLLRQPTEVQLRHLGDYQKVELFRTGELEISQFTNSEGNSIGLRDLKKLTMPVVPSDTRKFAIAKEKLDAMRLGVSTPEDLFQDKVLTKTLRDYYLLQAGELDGLLSITNFRGTLIHTKRATRKRVLLSPPREDQLKFNPITGRYEDVRRYQPNPEVYANNLRLLNESKILLDKDKEFIAKLSEDLKDSMSMNERAVILDNLRIIFTRYRRNPKPWVNFKAVAQAQIKYDVMNVSDALETQIRKDSDILKKLTQSNYIDPILGATQLDDLHDNFIANIFAKNNWEDTVAPQLASELRGIPTPLGRFQDLVTPEKFKELRGAFDLVIIKENPLLWKRLNERTLQQFYLRMAHRLGLADTPDRDQLAIALGRDLYNLGGLNGDRFKWYKLGLNIIEDKHSRKFFEVETYGVQKRRMKSRLSGQYFGPYYDTLSYNIRITDPRIQEYAKLTRKVEVGLRVNVLDKRNKLYFREGYKTYFTADNRNTRIPVTSTSSFSDFPEEFIDKNLVEALNWASSAEYKIDPDFYDFTKRLLYFTDDRGRAAHFNELNEYRKFMAARGDLYERFKAMEWLRGSDRKFSSQVFIDHRGRVYDRGLISPQSGETFRPFLNTAKPEKFSKDGYLNLQDQIGAFLGGLDDYFEGNFSSLTITGRQKIAAKFRPQLIEIGNYIRRNKPNDIRALLEHPLVTRIEGEEQGKFFRLALETAKIDEFLEGKYTIRHLERLKDYEIHLALEQDASSSGAQIIALTTKNKRLAEMSNVVPTHQKRRLNFGLVKFRELLETLN
jgi:SPP1 gp7 family putative phage head morphogenesis protein